MRAALSCRMRARRGFSVARATANHPLTRRSGADVVRTSDAGADVCLCSLRPSAGRRGGRSLRRRVVTMSQSSFEVEQTRRQVEIETLFRRRLVGRICSRAEWASSSASLPVGTGRAACFATHGGATFSRRLSQTARPELGMKSSAAGADADLTACAQTGDAAHASRANSANAAEIRTFFMASQLPSDFRARVRAGRDWPSRATSFR